MEIGGNQETEESADHKKITVREIDHGQNAIDHGVAQGDQRIDAAQLKSVKGLLEYIDHRIVYTNLNQNAIFVGVVVSVLNVFTYTPPAPPPSRLNIIFDLEAV